MPALFAEPYGHFDPDLAFVLDDGTGRAVGYIVGTADTGRFVEDFRLGALRGQGVAAVHLGMVTVNTAARAFYDRLGFHEIAVEGAGPLTYLGRSTTAE